jgi:DNA replication protein DnaC
LKAPTLRESAARLAERARSESWTHEEYLAACLQREVAARDAHGGEDRIRGRAKASKSSTLIMPADWNATWSPTSPRWTSSPPKRTWSSSAHPAPAKPTWRSGSRSAAAKPGTGYCSPPPANWVDKLADAHNSGRLQAELLRLSRYPLLVIDEVGYIPFEPEAANLFFQLVSSRYERASLIVTSNKPFGRWGEVFGDEVVAAAMIDRLVHHAEVVSLRGDSYRLKNRDLGRVPADTADPEWTRNWSNFTCRQLISFRLPLTAW